MSYLHDILDRQAARAPARPAVTTGSTTGSFGRLRSRAREIAAHLVDHGVRPGDRVLIHAANDFDAAAAIFGCSYADAVFVVLNSHLRPFHLDHIVGDCAPVLALVSADLAAVHSGTGVPAHPLDSVAGASFGAVPRRRPPTQPACLIYTSGSTGLPKAVVSPHRQMLFAIDAIGGELGYRSDDTVFCCLPLSFDYGLYQLFLAVASGAHLVLDTEASAGPTLLARITETGTTVFAAVPALAATLARLIRRSGNPPRTLRMVTNTGAALADAQIAALRDWLPGLEVFPMYGLTECKRVSILRPHELAARPGSVGRPLPGTRCRVVDESGRSLPPEHVGELVVEGPHVMAGYWNDADLTARRFRPDGAGGVRLHTGDQFRIDAEGYLYFVGRADDMYKQNGFRVEPAEVERAALDIPGVEQAMVLPPDGDRPARIFVTGVLSEQELLAGLGERIEPYKVPPLRHLLPSLPLTPNGKVDRRSLAEFEPGQAR